MKKIALISVILSIQPCLVIGSEWIIPAGAENSATVYIQGMMDSQKQCAKYCGPKGFRATTGEHVSLANSAELIYRPFIGKELDEVVLTQKSAYSWYNPLNLMHYIERYAFALQLKKYGYIVIDSLPGMPSISAHAMDFFKLNFGQERDIDECSSKIELAEQAGIETKILFGASRGAATIFNAHAQNNYKNIKMIILEGCFDTVEHVVEYRAPAILKKIALPYLFLRFISLVTEYKLDGTNPLKNIEQFPKDVPVVFITSQVDKNVPMECTLKVVEELRKVRNNVHLLILEESGHNHYALGNGEDQIRYLKFMHQLYKQYGLPYISRLTEDFKD